MKYVDETGKVFEISYSQKLQAEQNQLIKQKNYLIAVLIALFGLFFLALVYLYTRIDVVNLLTRLSQAL